MKTTENYICEIVPVYKTKRRLGFSRVMSNEEGVKIIRKIITNQIIEHYEVFGALFLNSSLKVMGYNVISKGGMSHAIVDLRLLFQNALICNASKLIVFHNHPGGNAQPTLEDKKVVKKIKKAGKILDVQLLDSIIITTDDYYSFLND